MPEVASFSRILPFKCQRSSGADDADLRFRTLLGERAWALLPPATRARFGKRIGDGQSAAYEGEIIECRMSRSGWLLTHALGVIGAPLPLWRDEGVPAAVLVTEDKSCDGQFWTRIYGRRRGFPQVILSSKRFAGPTGIEEHVGCGLGIALRCEVVDEALHFVSDHYFLTVLGLRLRIPQWLEGRRLLVDRFEDRHRPPSAPWPSPSGFAGFGP